MSNYEQVIRQVIYCSRRPDPERRFRLTCSELNGRYTSNEFHLEVSRRRRRRRRRRRFFFFFVCFLEMLRFYKHKQGGEEKISSANKSRLDISMCDEKITASFRKLTLEYRPRPHPRGSSPTGQSEQAGPFFPVSFKETAAFQTEGS